SLYEVFPAVEARRLVERFEWHYTPKHGSWLNLAESELGVLTSQCLDRRIPNKQILIDEIAAWEHDRNANHTKADWQFTTKNARTNLKHLSPAIGLIRAISGATPAARRSFPRHQRGQGDCAECRKGHDRIGGVRILPFPAQLLPIVRDHRPIAGRLIGRVGPDEENDER